LTIPVRDAGHAETDVDFRLIGRLSIAYMMTVVTALLRTRPVDFVDVLIVTAIYNANGETKRGISRKAIHKMLKMPLETVRRRINRLIAKQALIEQEDGLVFVADAYLGPGSSKDLDELNLQQLRLLIRAMKAHGLE
jgi:hypothetical protein